MKRKRIVVLGYMGACPLAGVVWQHLHYILGLQDLGHEVYYIEDTARCPYNPVTRMVDEDWTYAAHTLEALAVKFGFRDRWAFRPRYLAQPASAGLAPRQINALYAEADAILNVCASHELHEDLCVSDRLILVESDPVFVQVKADQGDAATLAALKRYRRRFTFGENIGTDAFPVPLHGIEWLPTRQPVVARLWETSLPPPPGAAYTTVTNWSASASIEWRGTQYLWSKSEEFMKFVDAPVVTAQPFELATDIPDPATEALFRRNRWRLLHPDTLNHDPEGYVRYVQGSKGEFTATKQIVVALNTGWFSDRSACYLAAGRPVITQQTGFTRLYGGERGLFGFSSMEEIADATARIQADYAAHSRAARDIAREFFDAGTVLRSLLERSDL